jgi:hypothetical protein
MRIVRGSFAAMLAAGLIAGLATSVAAQGTGRVAMPTVTLEVADWLPPWDSVNGGWGVVPAGTAPTQWTAFSVSAKRLQVAPGKYDAYWVQQKNLAPILVASNVDVGTGGATVAAANGVKLVAADWARFDSTAGWVAMRTGGARGTVVNSTAGTAMLLPLGDYDIYWRSSADGIYGWLTTVNIGTPFASLGLQVKSETDGLHVVTALAGSAGQRAGVRDGDVITAVDGKSLIGLDTPAAVTALRGPPGSTSQLTIVRLGATRLAVARDAQPTIATVRADSGIRLRFDAGQTLPLDPTTGWWGALFKGDDVSKVVPVNRSHNPGQPITLTPAVYDVYWWKDGTTAPQLIAAAVNVEAGKLADVNVRR